MHWLSAPSIGLFYATSLGILIPDLGHGLAEINLDPPIVHERVVHLEVCFIALFFVGELDKGVAQGVAGIWVTDYFCPCVGIEAREY